MIANAAPGTARSYSEEISQLRTLIDASPDVICSFDGQGRFLSASRASLNVWGYSEKELLGTRFIDYVIEEDRCMSLEIAGQIMSGIDFTNFENHYRRKDGSIVPIVWSATWDKQRKMMFCVAKDGTEKKRAQTLAKEYEDRLFRAYKLSQVGWWEWDPIKTTYHASDELYMIYGFTRDQYPCISVDTFLQHVHPKDVEKVKEDMALVNVRTTYEYSHWFIKPDGESICLMHHVHVHRDDEGRMVLINGTTKDITQARKSRIALKKSKRKIQSIIESIQDCFFVLDKNWKVTYWNKKAEEVLGKKSEDMVGKVLWDEFNESMALKSYTEYHRAMENNVAVRFEDYAPSLNRWFEATAYPSKEGLSVYFKDITDRKEQEEQLKISNERYQCVAMASTDIIWDWDLATGDIYINESFEKVFGVRAADPKNILKVWSEHLHPEDKNRISSSLQEATQNPSTSRWKRHYRIIRKDGETGYLSAKAIIIRNEKGNAIRMVGSVRDITEVRKREEAERQLQLRYKLLFEESPAPKWIFDPKTLRFIEVNEAAVQHYGYSRAEWMNMSILDLRADAEKERAKQLYKGLTKQSNFQFHGVVKHKKKNGELIDVELTSHTLKFRDTFQIVSEGNDVTEKIEAQKQVGRAIINTQEKERSIIGKELHDNVNQLLTTAKLYVQNASYYPEQKQYFLDKGVDIIQKSITEIRGLSKALITPTLSDIGFKETVDELIAYYKELNFFNVELTYFLNEENVEHELLLSIYRILQELFNNTIKYAKAKKVWVYIYETQHYLRVAYNDDGVGFDPGQFKKGLGLNNIKNRVEIFKGKSRLKSELGKGVTALIVFPVLDKTRDIVR